MTLAFGDKLAGGDIFEVRRTEQHRSPGGLVDSVGLVRGGLPD